MLKRIEHSISAAIKRNAFSICIAYKAASLDLCECKGNTAVIRNLYSTDRRKGYASRLLQEVTEYADKYQIKLRLRAGDYYLNGDDWMPRPKTKKLIMWYRKYGFVFEDTESTEQYYKPLGIREPKNKHLKCMDISEDVSMMSGIR